MADLATLRAIHTRASKALAERKGQQQRLLTDRAAAQEQLEEQQADIMLFEQTALLLTHTATHARSQAKAQIESLVTSTLQSVFGSGYGFRIELVERAGRPEAEFYVTSEYGGERLETRPQDSRGGGVVDVVSLGTRIAMIETYRPRQEGALVLDEPAKHVSDEFVQPVASFLSSVVDYFHRQIIMVTHIPSMAATADRTFLVELMGDASEVKVA